MQLSSQISSIFYAATIEQPSNPRINRKLLISFLTACHTFCGFYYSRSIYSSSFIGLQIENVKVYCSKRHCWVQLKSIQSITLCQMPSFPSPNRRIMKIRKSTTWKNSMIRSYADNENWMNSIVLLFAAQKNPLLRPHANSINHFWVLNAISIRIIYIFFISKSLV